MSCGFESIDPTLLSFTFEKYLSVGTEILSSITLSIMLSKAMRRMRSNSNKILVSITVTTLVLGVLIIIALSSIGPSMSAPPEPPSVMRIKGSYLRSVNTTEESRPIVHVGMGGENETSPPRYVHVPFAINDYINDGETTVPSPVWQTVKSLPIIPKARDTRMTWFTQNPSHTFNLFDDTAVDAFFEDFLSPDMYKIYQTFPLGVMKADFWRYSVIYRYGGVYSDLDTKCLKPIAEWFPPETHESTTDFDQRSINWDSLHLGDTPYANLTWKHCSLVIAPENNFHMSQWTIVSSIAGHPLLARVIDEILTRAEKGFDMSNKNLVHAHTGPAVWTDGIIRWFVENLGIDPDKEGETVPTNASGLVAAFNGDSRYNALAQEYKVCLMGGTFYGGNGHEEPEVTRNVYGSTMVSVLLHHSQGIFLRLTCFSLILFNPLSS